MTESEINIYIVSFKRIISEKRQYSSNPPDFKPMASTIILPMAVSFVQSSARPQHLRRRKPTATEALSKGSLSL